MGGSSSRPVSNRPSDKQVGSCCATLGCLLAAIALFLNELISFWGDSDDNEAFAYCGFDGLRAVNDQYEATIDWAYCCDDRETTCNTAASLYFSYVSSSFWTVDAETDDYCDTSAAGIAWLCLGCAALICALIAIGAVAFQREWMSKFGEIGACLCAGIACAAFFFSNSICWDSDRVDDEQQRIGASVAMMICAAVCFGIGAFFSR